MIEHLKCKSKHWTIIFQTHHISYAVTDFHLSPFLLPLGNPTRQGVGGDWRLLLRAETTGKRILVLRSSHSTRLEDNQGITAEPVGSAGLLVDWAAGNQQGKKTGEESLLPWLGKPIFAQEANIKNDRLQWESGWVKIIFDYIFQVGEDLLSVAVWHWQKQLLVLFFCCSYLSHGFHLCSEVCF